MYRNTGFAAIVVGFILSNSVWRGFTAFTPNLTFNHTDAMFTFGFVVIAVGLGLLAVSAFVKE